LETQCSIAAKGSAMGLVHRRHKSIREIIVESVI